MSQDVTEFPANQLKQSSKIKGIREFEIVDDKTLKVHNKSWFSENTFFIDLSKLADEPERVKYIAVRWCIAAFFCLVFGSLFLGMFFHSGAEVELAAIFGGSFLIAAGISVRQFITRSYDWYVFKNLEADRNHVLLFSYSPDKKTVKEFLAHLSKSIRAAKNMVVSEDEKQRYLLQQVQILYEQGYIDKNEAKAIASRIENGLAGFGDSTTLH